MTEKIEPLVSVVTPFYNTEEFLAECIESVLAQTYQNWEYILVNNCSTDKSAEIAQSYSKIDKRIRLIHNEHFYTQVQNYNHALRQISAKSEYCKIVQADDVIFPECISKMVSVAENSSKTGIVSAYRLCGTIVRNVGLNYKNIHFQGKEACRAQLIYGGNYFGSPSSVLFRANILRNKINFYREDIYFEDTVACFEILKIWNLGFVHQILSFEREDNESISSKIRKYDPMWLLAKFIIISEFGKYYLNEDEFAKIFSNIRNDYFKFLAEKYCYKKDDEFWKYHIDGMRTVGYDFQYSHLTKYILLKLVDLIGNPKNTAIKIYRNINKKK